MVYGHGGGGEFGPGCFLEPCLGQGGEGGFTGMEYHRRKRTLSWTGDSVGLKAKVLESGLAGSRRG